MKKLTTISDPRIQDIEQLVQNQQNEIDRGIKIKETETKNRTDLSVISDSYLAQNNEIKKTFLSPSFGSSKSIGAPCEIISGRAPSEFVPSLLRL